MCVCYSLALFHYIQRRMDYKYLIAAVVVGGVIVVVAALGFGLGFGLR